MPQALMELFGGKRIKTNMAEFSAECHSVDCKWRQHGFNRATILGSNKIKVIVLDDQKSRELRRIRTTCSAG